MKRLFSTEPYRQGVHHYVRHRGLTWVVTSSSATELNIKPPGTPALRQAPCL